MIVGMKLFWPLSVSLALLLAACDTPSPAFRGIPATRVTVDGSTFDVRVLDNQAEALRVNAEYAPRFGPIRDRAARAMAQVSGCEVRRVTGDQALAFGALKCGKTAPKTKHRTPDPARDLAPDLAPDLECITQRGTVLRGVGQVSVDVSCYPVL